MHDVQGQVTPAFIALLSSARLLRSWLNEASASGACVSCGAPNGMGAVLHAAAAIFALDKRGATTLDIMLAHEGNVLPGTGSIRLATPADNPLLIDLSAPKADVAHARAMLRRLTPKLAWYARVIANVVRHEDRLD